MTLSRTMDLYLLFILFCGLSNIPSNISSNLTRDNQTVKTTESVFIPIRNLIRLLLNNNKKPLELENVLLVVFS